MADIKDIDLSFIPNKYGDFSSLGKLESIRARMYNDFFIGSREIHFDNEDKENMEDYLEDPLDFITMQSVQNLIEKVINRDERINAFSGYNVEEDSRGINLKISTEIKNEDEPNQVFTFIVEKT